MSVSPTKRRSQIRAAIEATGEGETITLDELMVVWGTAKGTFINTRNLIPWFPEVAFVGAKSVLNYPRLEALEALWRWETRGDAAAKAKGARINRMLGVDDEEGDQAPNLSDMARASSLRADIEARMEKHGELVSIVDVRNAAGRVFEVMSRNLSHLETLVDPNAKRPAKEREELNRVGREILLRLHKELKDMLAPHVDPIATGGRRARATPRRDGDVPPPRKRGKGVAKPARPHAARSARHDKPVGDRKAVHQRKKRAPR